MSGRVFAGARALYRAAGVSGDDMGKKPIIAIANSFDEFLPGHVHLNKVGRIVSEAIREAGGIPREFNTMAVDDGIAMGHTGMLYSLPSRDIIADTVEYQCNAHCADALICIPNCDKVVPGMLMAALRLNIPTVFVSGGPMEAGTTVLADGTVKSTDLIDVMYATADDNVSDEELLNYEKTVCPTCGSCAGMFTANSMNCLTEAIGLALPGNGTIPAVHAARIRLAKEAGERVMELLRQNIRVKDILTPAAFENALRADMAIGCSSNTVLHLLAVSYAAGCPVDLKKIDAIGKTTPQICKLNPASQVFITDLNEVGGIQAMLKELDKGGMIHRDLPTVSGTVGERIDAAREADGEVIAALAQWPALLTLAGDLRAPHRIAHYLEDLAAAYHKWYNVERVVPMPLTEAEERADEQTRERTRIAKNPEPARAAARLKLNDAVQTVIAEGLDLLGVTAPDKM